MKKLVLLAASALFLTMLVPEPADAQAGVRRGAYRGGVARGGVVARRGYRGGYAYRGGYGYRGGYRRGPGWAPAVGLGVLGAAAVGAAAAAPYYGGYGYADPCVRQ